MPLYSAWPVPRPLPATHHITTKSRSLVNTVSLTPTRPAAIVRSFRLTRSLVHTKTRTYSLLCPSALVCVYSVHNVSVVYFFFSPLLFSLAKHTPYTVGQHAAAAEERNSCVDWSVTRNIILYTARAAAYPTDSLRGGGRVHSLDIEYSSAKVSLRRARAHAFSSAVRATGGGRP